MFEGKSICVTSPVTTHLEFCADARQEHEHLLGGGVLRLVENDERVRQGAAAHVGERRDLDRLPRDEPLDLLGLEHVAQRIIKRTQVWRDFFLQIAGQKAERLAGFNRRTSQDDAAHLLFLQRRDRHGHGEIRLAGSRRTDPEHDVVLLNRLDVLLLPVRARDDRRLPGGRRES